jgi:hypothetical protein
MLEIICGIGMLVIGVAFLGMLGLIVYYFNKMLNYVLYISRELNYTSIEELPDSISLDGLEDIK